MLLLFQADCQCELHSIGSAGDDPTGISTSFAGKIQVLKTFIQTILSF